MRRYEGLFILNTAGKEEGADEIIDKISSDISAGGGRVENIERMDKRNFARIADRKHQSGYYVGITFESEPSLLEDLQDKYALNDEIFRIIFTRLKAAQEAAPAT